MIKKIINILLISVIPLSNALAKIGDCDEIQDGNVFYKSHLNYVEAYYKNNASENSGHTVIWHKELFPYGYIGKYNPEIEEDVQVNIACVEGLTPKGYLLATDSKGRRFYLNRKTGKVILKLTANPKPS